MFILLNYPTETTIPFPSFQYPHNKVLISVVHNTEYLQFEIFSDLRYFQGEHPRGYEEIHSCGCISGTYLEALVTWRKKLRIHPLATWRTKVEIGRY